ncbi:MAG: hypothetical protein RL641_259 [Candidatus Parcubacteria bacterium]
MQDEIELLKSKWLNQDWDDLNTFEQSTFVSDKPLVIIGGCARSGTTLMRVILDSHSMLHSGPHTNLFVPIKIDPSALAFQSGVSFEVIKRLLTLYKDRAEFISYFIDAALPLYNKKLFCDKTARNILTVDWIMKHFPNAKIIHVVRDGLDVVCSLRTHRKRKVVAGSIINTGIRMPLELCVERWVNTMESALKYRDYENYYEVKYETLVTKTEPTLIGVCTFLNITYDPRMLRYFEFQGSTRDPLKFIQNIEATFPIFTTSIGRWKKELSPHELDFVLPKIQKLRNTFGYDKE